MSTLSFLFMAQCPITGWHDFPATQSGLLDFPERNCDFENVSRRQFLMTVARTAETGTLRVATCRVKQMSPVANAEA